VMERSEHAGRIWGAQPACTPGTLAGRAFVRRLDARLPEAPPLVSGRSAWRACPPEQRRRGWRGGAVAPRRRVSRRARR
jgi:hypothetical protein